MIQVVLVPWLLQQDNFTVLGNLKSMNEDKVITFNELIDEDDQVKIGDPVVTSYIMTSIIRGILIGYITSMEKNANNLTK